MPRVALVTGGTRGIGLGIARRLVADGAAVVLCGVRPDAEVADVLADLGPQAAYVRADVGVREDRERLLMTVLARHGTVHALVNNAGVAPSPRADLLDATEESFERLVRINLQGPYFLTQAVARHMVGQAAEPSVHRCIVNVTSVSAVAASVNRGDYCLTKAALSMATRLWAARLAPCGIAVYEVRPGIIDTDMTAPVRERYDQLIANGLVPERRWGTPDDVGRAVATLIRGDVPYSTAAVLTVDGGLGIPVL